MSISTALKARREQLRDREAGFTLIELLVVVIIIGILAAIAIPVYIGVQNNAKDSSAQSDLTNIKTAENAYYAQNSTYTTDTSATTGLGNFGYVVSAANGTPKLTVTAGATGTFCASVTSGSGTIFKVTPSTSPASAAAGC